MFVEGCLNFVETADEKFCKIFGGLTRSKDCSGCSNLTLSPGDTTMPEAFKLENDYRLAACCENCDFHHYKDGRIYCSEMDYFTFDTTVCKLHSRSGIPTESKT